MIDFKAFLRACDAPFSPADNNCFTAAIAAYPYSERVAKLANWWRNESAARRTKLNYANLVLIADGFAQELGFSAAIDSTPTGREIGIATGAGLSPTMCVGANGSWFARGTRGAMRIPNRYIVRSWVVE